MWTFAIESLLFIRSCQRTTFCITIGRWEPIGCGIFYQLSFKQSQNFLTSSILDFVFVLWPIIADETCLYKGQAWLLFISNFISHCNTRTRLSTNNERCLPKRPAKVQKWLLNQRKRVQANQVLAPRRRATNANVSRSIIRSTLPPMIFTGKETYSIYIYKVLKQVSVLSTRLNRFFIDGCVQVHPDTGISSKAMSIMNSFVNDIFGKFDRSALLDSNDRPIRTYCRWSITIGAIQQTTNNFIAWNSNSSSFIVTRWIGQTCCLRRDQSSNVSVAEIRRAQIGKIVPLFL